MVGRRRTGPRLVETPPAAQTSCPGSREESVLLEKEVINDGEPCPKMGAQSHLGDHYVQPYTGTFQHFVMGIFKRIPMTEVEMTILEAECIAIPSASVIVNPDGRGLVSHPLQLLGVVWQEIEVSSLCSR